MLIKKICLKGIPASVSIPNLPVSSYNYRTIHDKSMSDKNIAPKEVFK